MIQKTTPNLTKLQRKKNRSFFLYIFPALFFFTLFKYWPIFYSFVLSFFKWNFVGKMRWVGLTNYAEMFARNSFLMAMKNTLLYIVGLFPFFVILPLIFAVFLSQIKSRKWQDFYKALLFIPSILAFSIICLVWMWIFNPSFGVLNNFFSILGYEGMAWLSDKRTALMSVVAVSGWKYIGSNMILFVAGLSAISAEYVEAARIDGANSWHIFWKIKWPLLGSTTVFVLISAVIYAAERAFTPINILTKGGPAEATTNLSHIIYVFGFEFFNIGLASATAIFTSLFFFLITKLMMKYTGGFGYYES